MAKGGPADDRADGSWCFSDFAVVFRTNEQSRALEETLSRSGIPYQIVGKGSRLQRKAADETIAFLRSLAGTDPDGAPGDSPAGSKLLSPADLYDPRADAVTLMTMHMAKGLEFRAVFIAGVEEGLVPCTLMKNTVDIEEERRLFYVGMTRARDELFLLHARSRFLYGQCLEPTPSPFLREIPEDLVQGRTVPDRPKNQRAQDKQLGLF
jgi:superfamily I DNA/RNA helicase